MTFFLNSTASPSLPFATPVYNEPYINQLNTILRLYFNTIDAFTQGLLAANGAKSLSFPYIAASDSTDQYASATNTPTAVKWDTLVGGSGFTLNPPGTATCQESGVYKITYSAQLVNTSNAAQDAVFWLRVNGVDVADSATSFTVPARKSVGDPSYVCGYSDVVFEVSSNDVIALYWATSLAYNPTGPVDGVYIFADVAQTSPYARPAIPSMIGSITFISRNS